MNSKQLTCGLLIKYLKHYGVKHIIISSGTRVIPFIKAIESDQSFICHSVVDERNAVFFALGISQQLCAPVAVTCTSGTAASNYLSGMTEAFYSHTPIVAITADRSMYTLNQLETQKINQPSIFEPVTQKSICLPIIKDADDFWYSKRLLDEAYIAMTQHGKGPIHINVPFDGTTNDLTAEEEKELYTNICPISYYTQNHIQNWRGLDKKINSYKRTLLILGQCIDMDDETRRSIAEFCGKRRIPVLADNLSNFRCDGMILAGAPIKALNKKSFEALLPDLVISVGNNFQERIKDLLKAHKGEYDHWLIDEGGIIRDWSRSLTSLFETTPRFFFDYFNNQSEFNLNESYLEEWKRVEKAAKLPETLEWSNFYLVKEFVKI